MATPQLVSSLDELPSFDVVGIVINIDTRVFTTLAVASAARQLRIPLLLIDGYSSDGSYETLQMLDLPVESYLIRMSRRVHGLLIDLLMSELRAKRVLLIDSDVEVKSVDAFCAMMTSLDLAEKTEAAVFASGYAHGDHDMTNDGMPHAWFCRRPWIPFGLFDRSRCKQLISEGTSFAATEHGNEFPIAFVARFFALRWKTRWARSWRARWLEGALENRRGVRSAFYIYDTGALVFEAAQTKGWQFADIGGSAMSASIDHFDGATRRTKRERWQGHSAAELRILDTLKSSYGIELGTNETR
jgi:hypothetical protein